MKVISPSASHKWKRCAAYNHLIEFAPRTISDAAEIGTATHAACEMFLQDGVPLDLTISRKDMLEAAHTYCDYVQSIEELTNCKVQVEWSFEFPIAGRSLHGTIDAVIIDAKRKKAYVIDLKTGSGESVDAYDNSQLLLYAIGTALHCKKQGIQIDNFHLAIVQPLDFQDNAIREWVITRDQLIEKANELFAAIKYSVTHATDYYSGYWCRLCNCITICPAMQGEYNLIKKLENRGRELTKEEKKEIVDKQKLIEKYMSEIVKGISEEIKAEKEKPETYGMKWVLARVNRQPTNKDQIIEEIKQSGNDNLIDYKMPTIKELTEIFGKKWVQERFVKPIEIPMVLVPDSDKRKPIDKFDKKVEGF